MEKKSYLKPLTRVRLAEVEHRFAGPVAGQKEAPTVGQLADAVLGKLFSKFEN